ncbi:MAG: DegT/DnrJ/EryC1/StrS family aminotransferase [Patescibacteria group bacterium]|nr:DegT/DnrJ/EryC1/StrS family aminotransferase [Patescibacteria group bacterium]
MSYRISFGDVRICEVARANIERALAANWITQGENVREFEKEFARRFGFAEAIAVNNGTAADMAACMALYEMGARRGDEVIVPACCFVACANSILAAGFLPRFVDIELETLNINPALIEPAITSRTAGIMAVHNMGKPAKLAEIQEIANAHKIPVIEDCCEAHGAVYRDRPVGADSEFSTFSFYAAHLVVAGEGGMVGVQNPDHAKTLRSVISHGRPFGSIYFDFQRFGLNLRMHELAAAVGREGLGVFDDTFQIRRFNLFHLLKQTAHLEKFMHFIKEEPHEVIAPHAFPLVLRDGADGYRANPEKLYQHLEAHGIQTKTLFGCLPDHQAFEWMRVDLAQFPVARYVDENGMHFGIHQYLTVEDLDYAADVLDEFFRGL